MRERREECRGYVNITRSHCMEYRNVLLVNMHTGPNIPSVHRLNGLSPQAGFRKPGSTGFSET